MKTASVKIREISESDNDTDSDENDSPDDNYESIRNISSEKTTITIEQLTVDVCQKKIRWLDLFNKEMEIFGSSKLSINDTVIIYNLHKIRKMCRFISSQKFRVISNLYGWQMILDAANHAGPKVEPSLLVYESKISEFQPQSIRKRWLKCLDHLQRRYPLVLTRIFVNEYVDKNDKVEADDMIQLIQEAYKKLISDSDWIDPETKSEALKRANKITRQVAYPDTIFDNDALEEEYEHKPNVTSIHFTNFLNHMMIKKRPDDRRNDSWIFYPLTINAFYTPATHSIWFPTGILQLPFFDSKRIAAVNFGMVGAIIGHEIGHAFDDSRNTYDVEENPWHWWKNETWEVYKTKTKCFAEQFETFCPEELQSENQTVCVRGNYTLDENLSDFTGLRASFGAYKMWVEKHGPEKRLPGLQQFSPEQLFFIAYAYNWCENIPLAKWVERYEHDPHAPAKYRVLGPLSNNKDFRAAFNCQEGPMNRGEKSCTMW